MENRSYSALFLATLFTFTAGTAFPQVPDKGITFQGVIKAPTGQFPTISGTKVLVKILSPNDCILREETFNSVNISNGYLNLAIGRGTPTSNNPDPVRDLKSVMSNLDNFSGLSCLLPDGSLNANKTNYEPQLGDVRKLRISLDIDQHKVVADFNMRAVAYAINAETADDSKKLGNKTADEFLHTNSSKMVTQQNVEDWFSSNVMGQILNGNYNAPTATTATTISTVLPVVKGGTGGTTPAEARANLELGPLAVKPLGDASMVLYGDGNWKSLPAGNMGTVYSLNAGAGLKTNKPSNGAITDSGELSVDVGTASGQIVQVQSGGKLPPLDGSQVTNVTAVGVAPSAALEMNKDIKTTENLQAAKAVTAKTFYVFDQVLPSPNSVGLKAPADMSASGGASYVLTLPDRKGAPGQVLAAKDGTGALEWISPSVGSVTSVQATAPLAVDATNAASPKVSIPKATGSVDGYLDKTDFASFAAKQPAGNYIVTLQGDVSSSAFTNGTVTTSVDKIKNITISAAPTYNGQVFRMQDGQLQPGFISMLDLRSNVTGALTLAATCQPNQTLTFNSATDSLKCENIAIDKSQVAGLGNLAAKSNLDLASNEATGTLPISKGGTGATTPSGAVNAILPSQNSQGGKFLSTNGSDVSWASIPSGGITNMSGDVTTSGSGSVLATVTKIQGNAIASGTPTDGILTWNSTQARWEAVNPPTCSQSQVLVWSSTSDTFSCAAIAGIPASNVTGLSASATTDTTNANNISSGTISYSRLPTGTAANTIAAGNDSRIVNALQKDGTIPMSGNLNVGGNKITNLGAPTASEDAANKQYVDAAGSSSSGVLVLEQTGSTSTPNYASCPAGYAQIKTTYTIEPVSGYSYIYKTYCEKSTQSTASCPSGMSKNNFDGGCIENSARAATNHAGAKSTCESLGYRLCTSAELQSHMIYFGPQSGGTGVTFNQGVQEWAGDWYYYRNGSTAYVRPYYCLRTNDGYGNYYPSCSSSTMTTNYAYRCCK